MIDNKFTKWCVDDADKTITVQIISDGVIISMNNNYDNTRLYIYIVMNRSERLLECFMVNIFIYNKLILLKSRTDLSKLDKVVWTCLNKWNRFNCVIILLCTYNVEQLVYGWVEYNSKIYLPSTMEINAFGVVVLPEQNGLIAELSLLL